MWQPREKVAHFLSSARMGSGANLVTTATVASPTAAQALLLLAYNGWSAEDVHADGVLAERAYPDEGGELDTVGQRLGPRLRVASRPSPWTCPAEW